MGDAAGPPAWFTEALATRPSIGSVAVPEGRIAVRSWGDEARPAVVLVHGGGAHSRWWDHVAPLLAAQHHVVAPDLAGHGDSTRRERYSIDSWTGDVEAVVAAVAPRPVVVGHSLGGMVTLRLAQRIGHSLGGIVLLDSIIGAPTTDRSDPTSYIAFRPPRRYGSESEAVARFRLVPPQPCPPWVLEHVAATSVVEQTAGWTWKFDGRVFADELYLALPTQPVDCRAALLRAEHGLVSRTQAEHIGAALGDATVAEVPDAGHHLMLDQPLAVVAALRVLLAAWHD